MGGAQPLAATMAGAAILCIEVDPSRIERRLETRYLDEATDSLDDAVARVSVPLRAERRALSVGLLGNAAELVPELARRGEHFDLVTDQTAAHDPLHGYVPGGPRRSEAAELRASDPEEYLRRARASIVAHVEGLLEFVRAGCYVFDYGNNLRGEANEAGVADAFTYPGFVPAYIRPLFCRGIGPFRWAALSGDAGRHRGDRSRSSGSSSRTTRSSVAGSSLRPGASRSRGFPRESAGSATAIAPVQGWQSTSSCARARVSAPVVIGRDHLDSGSVASPYRETEAMQDGSDAIADWPILNALLNVAAGATWVSVHHGGGVGIGNSIHAGMVVVADGTDRCRREARAGADHRPRNGRDASRGRGVRGGARRRASRRDRPSVDPIAGTHREPAPRRRRLRGC